MPHSLSLPCVAAAFLFLLSGPARANDNLISNPGFEEPDLKDWSSFVPDESKDKGCEVILSTDNPHSGTSCVELKSKDSARFTLVPRALPGKLDRGNRFRLSYWIRAGRAADVKHSPAFIVRMRLLDENGKMSPDNQAMFIGLNGKTATQSLSSADGLNLDMFPEQLPTAWTKVEAIFELPSTSEAMQLGSPEFFVLYTTGSIFLDDISLERVGDNTAKPSK